MKEQMKEQILNIMKDIAVANDEEHLLDINKLYECFDDNVNSNLVYAQMRLFKYTFCAITYHALDKALTDKDNEILKFYTEFVRDKHYVNGSLKSIDYSFVKRFYQDYASKLQNKSIDCMYDNIKHQFMPNLGHKASEHQRQLQSEKMKEIAKKRNVNHYEHAIAAMKKYHNSHEHMCNRHWYTDGVTNVFDYECPEGFRPGKIQSGWKKKQQFTL